MKCWYVLALLMLFQAIAIGKQQSSLIRDDCSSVAIQLMAVTISSLGYSPTQTVTSKSARRFHERR